MSTIVKTLPPLDMTAEQFVDWAAAQEGDDRDELVSGYPVLWRSERASHDESKAFAWSALRGALRTAGLDGTALTDGRSVRIDDRTVREPDAAVHSGSFGADDVFLSSPVIVVEVVSPSSVHTDPGRKLIGCVSVPSLPHHISLYGDDQRVVHDGRASAESGILKRIRGKGGVPTLSPPGFTVAVGALFDS